MKLGSQRLINLFSSLILAVGLIMTFGQTASAACAPYSTAGQTSTNPVFNNVCGVPNGIGDESNFVRLRPSTNGNDTDNNNNPDYTSGALTSDCQNGAKYDVWNYAHNDGTTNAQNVTSLLSAPLNTTNSNFSFSDTIAASNVAKVTDNASLKCQANQVNLQLVPGSVHVYSAAYQWQNMADSSLNNPVAIGSPTAGSGQVAAGWDNRVVMVYQVQVSQAALTTPTTTPTTSNTTPSSATPTKSSAATSTSNSSSASAVTTPATTSTATTQPLTNTGPGSTIAVFAVASLIAGLAYQRFLRYKITG